MNFEDILSQLDIPCRTEGQHHHCRSGWINFDCPYCGKNSQKWHMGYHMERGYLNCWRCGRHPLIGTLMEITGLSYRKIKQLVTGLEHPHFERKKPIGKLILPKGIKLLHSAHKKYLYNRGFNWKTIENIWKIKGIGLSSKLAWRIFIPIIYHSKAVSWTTRSISDSPKITRYISAKTSEEAIPHRELLYGEDFAGLSIIVTEGIFDVWRIGQGAVCTFGSECSPKQLKRIAKYPIRAICFDNEPEAQKKAKQLSDNLSVLPGKTYNVVLDSKDPAEETKQNIKALRKKFLD